MNIFYILLNISKFAESFLIMYTIRKIKKNKFVSKKVLNLNTIKNQKTQILDLRGIQVKFKSNLDLNTHKKVKRYQ